MIFDKVELSYKYNNLRADYVKNIWNVFDWSKIEKIYESYVK